ncbi:MAG: ferritin-like domain-containing protein [Verrucomicrobiales bacterium]|nr:ferritin-like domain-containing protein [Verrucomicrobiales bacterium]
MNYGDYLTTSEMTRWILDTDIAWDDIQPGLSLSQPDLLDRVRDSALIESFFPIFTPRVLDLMWDCVTSTAIFSVQLYESYKHFHVFAQYLAAVDYRPIRDEEVVAIRRRQTGLHFDHPARLLTRYLMSEHFAAHHFFKDAKQALDPVLAHILHLVAKDEVRHCQFGCDLLALRLAHHPEEIDDVLDEAIHFQHIGELVLPTTPVAQKNDFAAILAINRKIERLTGRKMSSRLADIQAA